MCGFVVLLNQPRGQRDLCADIAHRGPDATGHAELEGPDWHVSLHFRRLAVVDLDPRSDQPFGHRERGLLVYNGELYNAAHLRTILAGRGVRFRTEGDTEVLYQVLLAPDRERLLDQLDGMFAFALTMPDGRVLYGRDRLGIKPLYTAHDGGGRVVALASELEPLRGSGLLGEVDPVAVAQGAMFLWTPPPLTGWQRARVVPPGTVQAVRAPGFTRPELLWSASAPRGDGDIQAAVRDSVARQVRADVPVGLLLSGGLDSTWLAVELSRIGFTGPLLAARFGPGADSSTEPFAEDAPFAQRVADQLGRPLIWADLDLDVLRRIPELVGTMELPFGDPAAIALMQLSRAAREQATVLLSGLGVEELFLGYQRHQAVKLLQRIPRPAWKALAAGSAGAPSRFRERAAKFQRLLDLEPADWSWATQSYFTAADWDLLSPKIGLTEVTAAHRQVATGVLDRDGSPLEALVECDRRLFLPGLNLLYGDRASMRASVELRVPFLGEPVVAAAYHRQPAQLFRVGNGKARFRQAAVAAGVPGFVARRSKTGFGAPVRSLLRAHGPRLWKEVRRSTLFDELFDRRVADRFVHEHATGQVERGLAVFGLFCAGVWWERHVDGDSRVAAALLDYEAPSTRSEVV
jgi:asparagine synthase (glutamine-hydrolysing)